MNANTSFRLATIVLASILAVLATFMFAPDGGASAQDDPPPTTKPRPKSRAKAKGQIDLEKLVEMHNKIRADEKLPPLTMNPQLEAAALAHAKDMAEREKMSHEGSDMSDPPKRIERQGYHARNSAENVAEGQKTEKEVMKAWMNSPPHKKNILGDYTEIGCAVVKSEQGENYWCVDFGRPWPRLATDTAATGLMDALNKKRAEANLTPLKSHPILKTAAQKHAQAMANAGKFLKEDDDGKTLLQRARRDGYKAQSLGESDAMGQSSPAEVVKSWFDSENHRKIFLDPTFRDIGVGVAATKEGIPFWSILLGAPRT